MDFSPLRRRRILVVEDEYFLARELASELEASGASVAGPAPSVERALALLASEPALDAAVLDVNLGGEMVTPVAEALEARGIPFVFTTGYGEGELGRIYPRVARCEKPVEFQRLRRALSAALQP